MNDNIDSIRSVAVALRAASDAPLKSSNAASGKPLEPNPMLRLRYGNCGRGSASLPASLHFSKSITGLRLRRYLTELRATRKPTSSLRSDGKSLTRIADRQ